VSGPADIPVEGEPSDEEDDGEDLEEAIRQELPVPPLPRFGRVLAHLGHVQRDIRGVEEDHHDHTHAIPPVDVGDVDDAHRHDVVHEHLDEVFSLRLDQDRDDGLEVARHVHEVVAAQVRAHDLVAALGEARPPARARPDPVLRGQDAEADVREAGVEHRLHHGLRQLRVLDFGELHGHPGEGLHQNEASAPVEDEEGDAEGAEDMPIHLHVGRGDGEGLHQLRVRRAGQARRQDGAQAADERADLPGEGLPGQHLLGQDHRAERAEHDRVEWGEGSARSVGFPPV